MYTEITKLLNKKMKISLVSVPFSGHLKILSKMAKELIQNNKSPDITLIITGWDNISISQEDKTNLEKSGIKIIELNQGPIQSAQPMSFTFPRALALTDEVIEACTGSDYIIYDFFAIEGYIAGKKLQIPTICSIPAIMGPFDSKNALLTTGIENNAEYISALEQKYNVQIADRLEMVSDGFLLPSEYQNIQWSWPKFIKANNFTENRNIKNYLFMRPESQLDTSTDPLIELLTNIKTKKKIIYVSLGTVVTGNLWNNVPGTRDFIKQIFTTITKEFGEDSRYEVVVTTGRKVSDLFEYIPSNFHVSETVPQQQILKLADVFVTHAGGNSVNEAMDYEIPMLAIPFFGDQHLCADNISKLKIGLTFAADEVCNENIVDTESCHLERSSLNKNAIVHAVEELVTNPLYKKNLQLLKQEQPLPLKQAEKILINDKTLNWHEGDLLYGCNDDRKKLATLTGKTDFFRLCTMMPFSSLFSDLTNKESLPRIIDQFHDVLTNVTSTDSEISSKQFGAYAQLLKEYQTFIAPYLQKLQSLKKPEDKKQYDEVIWDMCLAGLKFFIYEKHKTIHFVLEKFNDTVNLATRRELAWIKDHWQDEAVKQHVVFYVIKDGLLCPVAPEKLNWFNQRPTPSFTDIAPELVDKNVWDNTLRQIRSHTKHLFFNSIPHKYPDELKQLRASGHQIITMLETPELAKKSLSNGEAHIFAIQKNGKATLIQKNIGGVKCSHGAVAENEAVICAGEVRLRSVCVKGQWLKVIDISNDSGHYMPNASGLPQAIKAFESLGYIVHRVTAIHTKVPESFNKVEESMYQNSSLTHSLTI